VKTPKNGKKSFQPAGGGHELARGELGGRGGIVPLLPRVWELVPGSCPHTRVICGRSPSPLSPQAPRRLGSAGHPARPAAQRRGADGRGEGDHQPSHRPGREDGGDGAGAHRVRRRHRHPGAGGTGGTPQPCRCPRGKAAKRELSWPAAAALQCFC